ncbi:hypothetical protein LPJ73_002219, partial [Coemansia sp. RSA 2703]
KAAPDGIDIYFDNVGGELLDAALANMKNYARVVICGAMSQYNNASPSHSYGVKTTPNILTRRAVVAGFIILDHLNTSVHEQFFDEISQLYREDKITYKIDETNGFENAPQVLLDQFRGKNFGKSIDYVPAGEPSIDDFVFEQVPKPTKDQLQPDQVIIKSLYLSVDPYMRGRMTGSKDSYVDSFTKGDVITNFSVAEVTSSASSEYKEGDLVLVDNGKWQTEYIVNAKDISKVPARDGISPKDYLGVLSMPAFTAYYGTVVIGKPKAGETILVSSASGAVGQMVVQIAKAKGLRVIGMAGSDDKVEYVKQLGADVAINYKTCGNYFEVIKKAAPDGIDIYFDNVGGELLDAAMSNIKDHARIVICGAITQYNLSSPSEVYRIKSMTNVLVRKATITGFIILEHLHTSDHKQFFEEFSQLYKDGKIKYRIHETQGFDNAPQALLDLFSGKNFGKSVVKV